MFKSPDPGPPAQRLEAQASDADSRSGPGTVSPATAPSDQQRPETTGTVHRLISHAGGAISVAPNGFVVHHDATTEALPDLPALLHPRLDGILLLSPDPAHSIQINHEPLQARALDFLLTTSEATGEITLRSPRTELFVSSGPLTHEPVTVACNRDVPKAWEHFRLEGGEPPTRGTLAAHLSEALAAAPPRDADPETIMHWLEGIDPRLRVLLVGPLTRPFARDEAWASRICELLGAADAAPAAEPTKSPPSPSPGGDWASMQRARSFDAPVFLLDVYGRLLGLDPEQGDPTFQTVLSFDRSSALQLHGVKQPPDSSEAFIFNDVGVSRQIAVFPDVGLVALTYDGTQRHWQVFRADGRLLVVDADGQAWRFSTDADAAKAAGSSFLLLTAAQIGRIRHVLDSAWVAQRDRSLYQGDAIRLSKGFILRIGRFCIDLRFQDLAKLEHYTIIGAVDGWKYEKFYLYRPLIYITAYSDRRVLEQLRLCIASLLTIGRFRGRIVVMTDVGRDKVLRLCEPKDPDQIVVLPLSPVDFVGYVCTKYLVYDSELFHGHQPVMYLDPDIICDRPADEMLVPLATCEKISAPLEDFHFLRDHPAVGATLLQLDGVEPIFSAGFNGGTIVFPNVANAAVRECFDLIRRTIASVGAIHGRSFNAWADQECANYICFKTGMIETSFLTPRVQHHTVDRNRGRNGLVHFWAHTGSRKVVLMRTYFYELLAESNTTVAVMLLQWADRED